MDFNSAIELRFEVQLVMAHIRGNRTAVSERKPHGPTRLHHRHHYVLSCLMYTSSAAIQLQSIYSIDDRKQAWISLSEKIKYTDNST